MKAIFLILFLIPSLAQALIVEGSDKWPAIGLETVPDTRTLREAMELDPKKIPPFSEANGSSKSRKLEIRATNLLLLGKIPEALEVLHQADAIDQLKISIYHNLALVYEMNGKYAKALDCSSAFPKPNPYRTALLAKIQKLKSGLPSPGRLLQIPDDVSSKDPIRIETLSYPAKEVKTALFGQLKERLLFTKTPDPYLADLLYSYALLEGNLGSARSAVDILKLAKLYGFPEQDLLRTQEKRFQKLALIHTVWTTALAIFSVTALVFLTLHAGRKKWHLHLSSKAKSAWKILQTPPIPHRHGVQGVDRF